MACSHDENMQPRRPCIVAIYGGHSARLQLSLVSFLETILRPVHHRGFWQAIRFLSLFFPPENAVAVSDGTWKFKIYLGDAYWARWLVDGFNYEDEVSRVLDRILRPWSLFIDCGANNGYWSLFAASKIGLNDRVVAIEAGETNFRRLCENMELNGGSFRTLQKAVYRESNLSLKFRTHPVRHGSNACVDSEVSGEHGYRIESVLSITVDDVFKEIWPQNQSDEVVVKIDVEGSEIEALKGAETLIANGALLIYEDHGADSACHVTAHILKEYGLEVYFLLGNEKQILRVTDVKQLAALKTRSHRGYNLVAARTDSPALCRLLESLRADERCR